MPPLLGRFLKPSSAQPADSISLWEAIAEEQGTDAELQAALQNYRKQRLTGEAAGSDREKNFRNLVIRRLHASGKSALCFSGGGIRSATFGLGVLQGLAAHSAATGKEHAPPLF